MFSKLSIKSEELEVLNRFHILYISWDCENNIETATGLAHVKTVVFLEVSSVHSYKY